MFYSSLLRRLRCVVTLFVLAIAGAGTTLTQAEVLASCGFSVGSSVAGDLINRSFYVTHFSGQSLQSVELRHFASSAGKYLIKMTARKGSFDGPIIGDPTYATATLSDDKNAGVQVTYKFGDIPVSKGSTLTFVMEKVAGPGAVYYDVAVPSDCSNIYQTDGSAAPLDITRRTKLGYRLSGRAPTDTPNVCNITSTGSDNLSRGIYIQNYSGETLSGIALGYQVNTTGTRTIRLTARQGGFNGPIIGTPQTKTLNFTQTGTWQVVQWDFGGAIIMQAVKNVKVTFTHEVLAGDSLVFFSVNNVAPASTCPNHVTTQGTSGALDTPRGIPVMVVWSDKEAPWRSVTEYYIPSINHYFISGRPGEQAILDYYADIYQRTGNSFLATTAINAPQGTTPICRFYLPPEKGGPNTHFYGVPADCEYLNGLNNPMFEFEGWDFAGVTPTNGTCPDNWPTKVYRSYNNRAAQNDSNHRYTTTTANYNAMTAQGWVPEGVVFCAPLQKM